MESVEFTFTVSPRLGNAFQRLANERFGGSFENTLRHLMEVEQKLGSYREILEKTPKKAKLGSDAAKAETKRKRRSTNQELLTKGLDTLNGPGNNAWAMTEFFSRNPSTLDRILDSASFGKFHEKYQIAFLDHLQSNYNLVSLCHLIDTQGGSLNVTGASRMNKLLVGIFFFFFFFFSIPLSCVWIWTTH